MPIPVCKNDRIVINGADVSDWARQWELKGEVGQAYELVVTYVVNDMISINGKPLTEIVN